MPIATESLRAAQVDASDNRFLKPLWKAVNSYNASGGLSRVASLSWKFDQFRATGKMPAQTDERRQRALALQDIMFNATSFLTCKPPDPDKPKRHPRWDAVTSLMAEVNREAAAVGVKLVDSPSDFRAVSNHNASVWLEVIDPSHRDFGLLSELYEKWAHDERARRTNQSFWSYIGDDYLDDVILYDLGAKSEVERNFRGEFTEFQGNRVDTRKAESLQSNGRANKGWGVFAVTTDGRLHVGKHSNDFGASVRHTSLTGGEPILAAGEICIVNGKIVAISNLTGHYKLSAPQFFNWLNTSPLISPDVVVKARVNVKVERPVAQRNGSGDGSKIIVNDFVVTGSTVGRIRKWVSMGKPADEIPLDYGQSELRIRVPDADFGDVKEFVDGDGEVVGVDI